MLDKTKKCPNCYRFGMAKNAKGVYVCPWMTCRYECSKEEVDNFNQPKYIKKFMNIIKKEK